MSENTNDKKPIALEAYEKIAEGFSKLAPAIGTINEANEKAHIIEGLANSTRTTSDILQDEMKSQEPKVFIEAGKPVLIYFMEGLNEY